MQRGLLVNPPPRSRVKYCNERLCVCLFASISPELHVQPLPSFLNTLPFLGRLLAALRYVMYFRFYGRRHVFSSSALSVDVDTVAVTPLQRRAQAKS